MSTAHTGLQSQHSFKISFKAEAAVTKYQAVIAGTDEDEVTNPGGANVAAVGLTNEAAAINGDVEVICFGPAKAIAAAAIARGDLLAIAGTTGKLTPLTVGETTGGNALVARALSAAGADGDEVSVWVLQNSLSIV